MPQKPPRRRRFTFVLGLLLLFVIYVATAKLGLALDAVSGFASLVWPPAGIAVAALVLFDRRWWPAIMAGAFIANITTGAPVLVAIGIAAGNTLEAVVAAWLLARYRFDPSICNVRHAAVLLCGTMVGTAISATIGVFSLWSGGVIAGTAFSATLRAWWIGDMLGVLVVATFLMVWTATPRTRHSGRVLAEAAAVCVTLVAISFYVFAVVLPDPAETVLRTPYFVFPPLIWAAIRFRQRGAVSGTLIVWIASIVATILAHGPFASGALSQSLLPLQLFTAVVATSTLFLGAAVSERDTAIEARDQFLAIASHELRTPLTTLTIQITNMREKLGKDALPPDKLLARLAVLDRQGDRLNTLVTNLLDTTRVISGQFDLVSEAVVPDEVVDEVVARCRDQAATARTPISVELAGSQPIKADRMRFEQVVTNLVGNALKFGAGKPIEIRSSETASAYVLRVRDHGVGIDRRDHERIFRRFERVSGSRDKGLGLGLWISREIVNAMGGTIEVDSELGNGAELVVTLPRAGTSARSS